MIIRIMLFGLIALSAVASAGDLYRWVDESGRTHIADSVPVPYQAIATRVDTSASEISESQRQEALARAAREKQLSDERTKAAQAAEQAAEQARQAASPPAATIEPQPSAGKDAECEALIREYRESQECFAPFVYSWREGRHRRSGVRQEAYLYCKSVPSPYAKCRPPSYSPGDATYPQ